MKIKFKIGLIFTFIIILMAVVWVASVQTQNGETVPVQANEKLKAESSDEKPAPPATQPVKSSFNKEKLDNLETAVADKLNKYKFNGSIIIAAGDEVLLDTSVGYSDMDKKEENQNDTRYEIGSVTKQFTAAAITKLADEKKLSLDDKLEKYFPDFKEGKKITIEQLVTMTSGVPDYLNEFIAAVENGERAEDSTFSKEEFLEWLYEQEMNFKPGEYFAYSNTNYYLLGLIIESVTGKTYEEYITEAILDPLYMYDTKMSMAETTANGYLTYEGEKGIKIDSSYFYSAGEMVSTTSDMLKWVTAYSRAEIISPEMFKKATSLSKAGYNYGYGWFICDDFCYHTGNTELFYAIDLFSSKNDIRIIALSNVNDIGVQDMGKEILDVTQKVLFNKEEKATASSGALPA